MNPTETKVFTENWRDITIRRTLPEHYDIFLSTDAALEVVAIVEFTCDGFFKATIFRTEARTKCNSLNEVLSVVLRNILECRNTPQIQTDWAALFPSPRKGAHRMNPPEPRQLAKRLRTAQVARHRNLSCPLYDHCLGFAAFHLWESFTCSQCANRFHSSPLSESFVHSRDDSEGYPNHAPKGDRT